MLFSETAFLLLYSCNCKQQVLLWQQQIFRTSNLVCSKQQSVLIISYKQLELVNYKLKISSVCTLMLIEQYIFLLSHSKIYSVVDLRCRGGGVEMIHNSGAPGHSVHIEDIHSVWSPGGTCTPAVEMSMVKDTTTEYIFLLDMKQGWCICPLSWSVHCNFTGDGKCNERGWACTPHPHQPGLILPSWLNVRQKAAVATLCTLWIQQSNKDLCTVHSMYKSWQTRTRDNRNNYCSNLTRISRAVA